MSVRSEVAGILSTAFVGTAVEGIKIVTTEREIGKLGKATILVKQQAIARLPAAPLSHRNVSVLITVISAHQDMDKAEDDLDVLVPTVLDALDNQAVLLWTAASKVGWGDSNLAYDINLDVIANKE